MKQADDLKKLYLYRDKLAKLVVEDGAYGPIFLRVEQEIAHGEKLLAVRSGSDVLARARLIASAQKAMA